MTLLKIHLNNPNQLTKDTYFPLIFFQLRIFFFKIQLEFRDLLTVLNEDYFDRKKVAQIWSQGETSSNNKT